MHGNMNVNMTMFEGSQASSACVLITAALRRIWVWKIGEITLIGAKIEVIGKYPVPLFTTYLTRIGPHRNPNLIENN